MICVCKYLFDRFNLDYIGEGLRIDGALCYQLDFDDGYEVSDFNEVVKTTKMIEVIEYKSIFSVITYLNFPFQEDKRRIRRYYEYAEGRYIFRFPT